ncbi:DMT family transporter [Stenoxybacter acetivorans]|uniref:DMT family transporter n=1 Tax=Stenoxybacter acetivorans TaxID=422441 RepID=UPI00068C7906|nr:DMT family transporter [Stenoxybacter acetivorans]
MINIDKFKIAFLFLIVCLAWGTTWITIKFSVESIPPILSSALRFIVAFPAFLFLAKITHTKIFPKPEEIRFYCIATVFYYSLPYALINYGELYLTSGLAALIFSTMPILILIFSHFLLKEKINIFQVMGILIGLIGFYFIIKIQHKELGFQNIIGIIALFAAAIMHAGYYVYVKKSGASVSSIAMNTIPLGLAGIGLLVTSLFFESININQISTKSILATVYLGIFASVIGFIAYFELLKKISPIVISFVFLIFPVFAIIFSSMFESASNINFEFILYFIVILFGFIMTKINTKPKEEHDKDN